MKDIEEIWIINNTGLCLFNYYSDKPFIENIFGQFISSINEFSKAFAAGGIKSLKFGNHKVAMRKINDCNLYIIVRASLKSKPKFFEKILKKIENKFIGRYFDMDLNVDTLDPNDFRDFKFDIVDYFDENNLKTNKYEEKWDGFEDAFEQDNDLTSNEEIIDESKVIDINDVIDDWDETETF
jgi:hypothetical protein